MGFERFRDKNFVQWTRDVKRRDKFTCQVCGRRGGILHAHHLFGWDKYVELRYDIRNGVTLDSRCHQELFHEIYGRGNNNAYQFIEFLRSRSIFIQALDTPQKDGYDEPHARSTQPGSPDVSICSDGAGKEPKD